MELRTNDVPIAIVNWSEALEPADRALGAKLLILAEDATLSIDDLSLFVDAERVAGFSDRELASAHLPEACPFVLELNAKGTIASPDFRFEFKWYRADRRRLGPVEIRGIELSSEGRRYVLTDPSYMLVKLVHDFNLLARTTLDERLVFWSRLCELTGLTFDSQLRLKPDRYLQNLRVIRAHKFTLNLDVDNNNEFKINPVLLTSGATNSNVDSGGASATTASPEMLLSPKQQTQFTNNFFSLSVGRTKCPVGDGTYVVFDDSVAEALTHIRDLRDADAATKRAFVSNPHGYLRERLHDSKGDYTESFMEAVENTYFETEGFSARVKGIGAWQKPTLPWVQAQTQGWLPPDKVHIDVRSARYTVLCDDLPDIIGRIDEAIAASAPVIRYGEQAMQADAETRSALQQAAASVALSAEQYLSSTAATENVQPKGPFALLAVDNFETGGYSSSRRVRTHGSLELPLLNTTLKPHQEAGLRWLQDRWAAGYRGALLADDMGLGKSLTILSFLLWLRGQMRDGVIEELPILMVVPTSLIHNWINEHNIHLPGAGLGQPLIAYGRELVYYRAESRKKDVEGGQPSLRTELLRNKPWIITTYETLRDYQLSFGKLRVSAAVFDEAQRVKNPGASLKNAAKNMNADFFIAATGTPVENRLADLWSIVDLIEPDYLGSLRDFSRIYETAPKREVILELKEKVDHVAMRRKETKHPDAGLMLRRMKDGTLRGLPAKFEHPVLRNMEPEQAAAYDDAIDVAKSGGKSGRHVLLALQGILSVSLHPDVTADAPDDEYIKMSARYTAAFAILDRAYSDGEKVLIFLEMLAAQTPLALIIQRRYKLRSMPMIINGEVAPGQRQSRVDQFQGSDAGFDVMILSPRAGGVGLTLTKANHVIHLSRWWNPAVEDQCTDRVYRIGQEKTVHVYYLQAIHPEHRDNSFDVKLHELLTKKRSLSRDLLAPPVCTEQELQNLFEQTVEAST
jgi:hypothetical protein